MFNIQSGALPSVMQHSFSQVPKAEIPRSSFNRSHGFKTTFNNGDLVPVFVDEALPGDTFNLKMSQFARLATPIVPFMDNLYCDSFFFAVPYRLVWDNWQKFNGEQDTPGDSTSFLIPQMTSPSGGYTAQSLSDYMGIPINVEGMPHSSLWHRAYNLIWNEWFRDQNLVDPAWIQTDDGPDDPANYTVLKRGKRHDYFTSSLPFPQKGPSVLLPLGTTAPVLGIGFSGDLGWNPGSGYPNIYQSDGGPPLQYPFTKEVTVSNVNNELFANAALDPTTGLPTGYPNIYADLSTAAAATINALRQAFQIQKIYERDARGGTRYTEIIKSHFGVTSPDARLQRPEYLGGGSTPINITPIPQTSETGSTPQGNLAAMGIMAQHGHGFTKSFTEHCLLIGMISVRADLNYQQGLNRMFSRNTRFDFYWPALSHIGEQAVLNKEIYAQGSDPFPLDPDNDVFGYQERYAEYRYKPSVISGQFRSTYSTPLDIWHLAQHFTSLPVLDSTFITENVPISRVIAVPSQPEFLFDAYFNLTTARPMPTYSVPGLIDHF